VHRVAAANPLERAKQAIAVGGDGAVAGLPRSRRIGKVAGCQLQRPLVVPGNDGCRQTESRYLQHPDEIGVCDRSYGECGRRWHTSGLSGRDRSGRRRDLCGCESLERLGLPMAKIRRVHDDDTDPAEAGDADSQQKPLEPERSSVIAHDCLAPGSNC
jgi:hypothetical protein